MLHKFSKLSQPLLLILNILPSSFLPEKSNFRRLVLENRLLIVREIVHHLLREFLNLLLPIGVSGFPVILPNYLGTGRLSIVQSVSQGCFTFLVLNFYKSFVLLNQELTDVSLTISSCEMQSCIPEFVLVIYLQIFLFAEKSYTVDISSLTSCE